MTKPSMVDSTATQKTPQGKDPAKVRAGQAGRLAEARDQQSDSTTRKSTSSTADLSSSNGKRTRKSAAATTASTSTPRNSSNPETIAAHGDQESDGENSLSKRRNQSLAGAGSHPTPTTSYVAAPKLSFTASTEKDNTISHLVMGKDHPLPVIIKTKDGKSYNITPQLDRADDSSQSFWRMVSARIPEISKAVGDETFGTLVDNAHQNLHLELASQLFPN